MDSSDFLRPDAYSSSARGWMEHSLPSSPALLPVAFYVGAISARPSPLPIHSPEIFPPENDLPPYGDDERFFHDVEGESLPVPAPGVVTARELPPLTDFFLSIAVSSLMLQQAS
ncbi:MAG: hypothetical protein ABW189_04640 [Rickettsiales bacterium]